MSSNVRNGLGFGGRSGRVLLCAGMWRDGYGEFGHSGTLSPGRGHCVVFLGKTLFSRCLSQTRCKNRYWRI